MHTGKLYKFENEQFIVDINYQLMGETAIKQWGELVPVDYVRMDESEDYMVELDDSQKIKCNLEKRVNRAVIGIPPRYIYHFVGKPISIAR